MLICLTELFFLLPFLPLSVGVLFSESSLLTRKYSLIHSLALCTSHQSPCLIILHYNFLNSHLFFLFSLLYPSISPSQDDWNHLPTPYHELFPSSYSRYSCRELFHRHNVIHLLSIFNGSSVPHGQKSRFLETTLNLPLSGEIIYQALFS